MTYLQPRNVPILFSDYTKGQGTITDYAPLLQQALADASGSKLLVPSGNYTLNSTITIPNGTVLEGETKAAVHAVLMLADLANKVFSN